MPPESPIGVVADGTPLLRAGLATALRDEGFAVPGETSAGAEVVELVRSHSAEVVVLGSFPDVAVIEVVRRLRAEAATDRLTTAILPHASGRFKRQAPTPSPPDSWGSCASSHSRCDSQGRASARSTPQAARRG